MPKGQPSPHMTSARAAWLRTLLKGPARRGTKIVGNQCMRLGWTDWVRGPNGYIPNGHMERITDAGKAALEESDRLAREATAQIKRNA